MAIQSPDDLRRQLGELYRIREERRDELVQALIAIDSIRDRIDVLLLRLHEAAGGPPTEEFPPIK